MTAINQIQSTTDYDQFKVLGGNRNVSTQHVNRLVAQIEETGNITQVSPIIVNEKFQVIDGQHRLRAAEKTGVPVGYLVKPGLVVEDALRMNITSKTWTPYDYLNLYVEKGYKPYVKFAELIELYPWATVTNLLMVIAGGDISGKLKKFKLGELEDFDSKTVETRLSQLEQIAHLNPIFIQGKMIRAYLSALSIPGFSHDKFYENFKASGGIFRASMFWFDNVNTIIDIKNQTTTKI